MSTIITNTPRQTPLVGHRATLDNMGWRGIEHPLTCSVRHTATGCPVFRALVEGHYRGKRRDDRGHGVYWISQPDDQGWVRLHSTPEGVRDDLPTIMAEVSDLLDALDAQIGFARLQPALQDWMAR